MFVPLNPSADFIGTQKGLLQLANGFPFREYYLCHSARNALLKALQGYEGGGTLWLPAFMCRSLLETINFCNFKIHYYDVNHKLQPELKMIEPRPGDFFLIVHYFGLYQELKGIQKYCNDQQMIFVEDCAHILPDFSADCFAGSTGDIAIFSFRKLLPVSSGGVLFQRQSTFSHETNYFNARPFGMKKKALMAAETLAFRTGFNFLPIKYGLRQIFGNTDSSILSGEKNLGGQHIENKDSILPNKLFKNVISRRKNNYNLLCKCMQDTAKIKIPFPVLNQGACPQFFPILVKNPKKTVLQLKQYGIEAAIWPGKEKIPISEEKYPGTRFWNAHLILLPVHHNLRVKHINYMAKILTKIFDDF